MAVAMTVGANKIKVMQANALADMSKQGVEEKPTGVEAPPEDKEECST
jgi:hypothetical protein